MKSTAQPHETMTTPAPSFTPETLPVTVAILSRWIDWTGWDKDKPDNTRPVFRFLVELTHGVPGGPTARRMRTEYGGGIMALIPEGKRKEWAQESRIRPGYVSRIMKGTRYRYDPANMRKGHASPEEALQWMLDHAEIKAASVCHSLVLDAQCGNETFQDFCENYGYDSDSRKALATYEACQKVGREFRILVGKDFDAIAEALQDY